MALRGYLVFLPSPYCEFTRNMGSCLLGWDSLLAISSSGDIALLRLVLTTLETSECKSKVFWDL